MKLSVSLGAESYDIHIERGGLSKVGELFSLDRRVLVVTDDGVPRGYAETVASECREAVLVTLPQGEGSKSVAALERLWSAMLEKSFTRHDCVVAVGGGVVGDLSGFAAATYMRGIDFYNIPTTLLSQVDSSIGGKTAVNFGGVKNIVGHFHQPRGVLIDSDTLWTLDERLIRAGLAEAIKMAVNFDAMLFESIEKSDNIMDDIDDIICRSLCIKRDVVENDPTEKGLRRVLNFGHTVGHAIESAAGGSLLHGECVALGMLPMCAPPLRARVKALLSRLGYETEITFTKEQLLPYLVHDKKAIEGGIAAVYADIPGSYRIEKRTAEQILECLEDKQ